MFKFTKKEIFMFIMGVIICSIVTVIADTIHSNDVLYDNSNSLSNSENVEDALDNLEELVQISS